MTKPIFDKAEIALEYPDKFYSGTFERSSRFEASFDARGVRLILERPGSPDERKSVHIHLNYGLFADVLAQLSATISEIPEESPNRQHLLQSVVQLKRALETLRQSNNSA
jgi:hypothetical protein